MLFILYYLKVISDKEKDTSLVWSRLSCK